MAAIRHRLQRFLAQPDQLVTFSFPDHDELITVAGDELPLLATFLVQPVHFDEGDADRTVLAAYDRGVISRRERRDDGALKIVGRR